jgi:hypothetical protein
MYRRLPRRVEKKMENFEFGGDFVKFEVRRQEHWKNWWWYFFATREGQGRAVVVVVLVVYLFGGSWSVSGLSVVSRCVRGPQSQVVTQKLHDQR